jgi:MvaI/BcnI restriction endonuclease family
MNDLLEYAREIVERVGKGFASGEVFAKVLTQNDDSGRHGVLIPTDAYSYFPDLPIPDPTQNATEYFPAIDAASDVDKTLAYKYYERYPERRITRLPGILNDTSDGPRILIFLSAKHTDGSSAYYFDAANAASNGRFWSLFKGIFGDTVEATPGRFVIRPVDSSAFVIDRTLSELLSKFDVVSKMGWIPTLREGHTGIGYTFETLLDIKENNDQIADFKGIEIKCKGVKEGVGAGTGKINLFQAGPAWLSNSTAKERIRILGRAGKDGLYACHSQVTTTPNNLGLLLRIWNENKKIDLEKSAEALGFWSFESLEKRLTEKHSRAAFVKAQTRRTKTTTLYSYQEFVYCDRPNIKRFVDLVSRRNIVFEFLMSEKADGSIRNHGYPWRLTRSEFLNALFTFQIRLR